MCLSVKSSEDKLRFLQVSPQRGYLCYLPLGMQKNASADHIVIAVGNWVMQLLPIEFDPG